MTDVEAQAPDQREPPVTCENEITEHIEVARRMALEHGRLVTFEEARAIVAVKRGPHYPPEAEFQVATWGRETRSHYLVQCGSYANVYGIRNDADQEFFYLGDSNSWAVDKLTGECTEQGGLDERGLPFELPDSVPVGSPRRSPE